VGLVGSNNVVVPSNMAVETVMHAVGMRHANLRVRHGKGHQPCQRIVKNANEIIDSVPPCCDLYLRFAARPCKPQSFGELLI
jgi:hypothetical protein